LQGRIDGIFHPPVLLVAACAGCVRFTIDIFEEHEARRETFLPRQAMVHPPIIYRDKTLPPEMEELWTMIHAKTTFAGKDRLRFTTWQAGSSPSTMHHESLVKRITRSSGAYSSAAKGSGPSLGMSEARTPDESPHKAQKGLTS